MNTITNCNNQNSNNNNEPPYGTILQGNVTKNYYIWTDVGLIELQTGLVDVVRPYVWNYFTPISCVKIQSP